VFDDGNISLLVSKTFFPTSLMLRLNKLECFVQPSFFRLGAYPRSGCGV
jgi:hypothetical protein